MIKVKNINVKNLKKYWRISICAIGCAIILLAFAACSAPNSFSSFSETALQEQNDELQSQNDELQSQNDELQTQIDELQTQNDELQTQIDELQIQNDELQQKVDEAQPWFKLSEQEKEAQLLELQAQEEAEKQAQIEEEKKGV